MSNTRIHDSIGVENHGFTLIEVAIVLVIVGIILLGVLRGTALVGQVGVSDLVKTSRDLSSATHAFKARYKYLPGDLPNANNDIPFPPVAPWGPPAGLCDNANGNGLIDAQNEIDCVIPHLFFTNFIESVEMTPAAAPFMRITKNFDQGIIGIRVVATAFSNFAGVYPPTTSIQHIVEFSNVPLEMARDLDRKLDDGNLNAGNVQGDLNPPVDPVAFLAVPL